MKSELADLAEQLGRLQFNMLVLSEIVTALGRRAGDGEMVPGVWLVYLGGLMDASADTLSKILDTIPDAATA